MGEHRIGQIMKEISSCLPQECRKRITNHSTRKAIVAKLKEAGQPRHKIIQVTGHARESSLDDYDEITEGERRELSHVASGYVAPIAAPASKSSLACAPQTSIESLPVQSSIPGPNESSSSKENIPAGAYNMLPFSMPSMPFMSMAANHIQQAPVQVFNQCVFNNNNK